MSAEAKESNTGEDLPPGLEDGSRFPNVAGDLFLERGERGELNLVAEFSENPKLQFPAVEVTAEIQEMSLGAKGRIRVRKGRSPTDIEDGRMGLAADSSLASVNALRRQDQSDDVQIGCGKAKRATELVARNDAPVQRIGPAEHLRGGLEVALPDRFANARAAHDGPVERNGGLSSNFKTQFLSEALEKGDVAGAVAAEGEITSDTDALDLAQFRRQLADVVLSGLGAESLIEADQKSELDPLSAQNVQLLRKGIDQGNGPFRGHGRARVTVKRNRHWGRLTLLRVGHRLTEDLLVAEMNSVKNADRNTDLAGERGELGGAVNDFHGDRLWARYGTVWVRFPAKMQNRLARR